MFHGVKVPDSGISMSLVNSSSHAMRMRAEVAGECKVNDGSAPRSFLAAAIASLMAKNVEIPRKRGGSPTACELYKVQIIFGS